MGGIAEREHLYRLMISQLHYDGYEGVAATLLQACGALPGIAPSQRLFTAVQRGFEADDEKLGGPPKEKPSQAITQACLDLQFDSEDTKCSPSPAVYDMLYATSHKAPCKVACFNGSGRLAATGSADSSIKVLDVDRMLAKMHKGTDDIHPVVRTFYDNTDTVTSLQFHPTQEILAAGSRDCTVKLFDHSKSAVKKALKTIQEVLPVTSISFHYSGDYMLVATQHPTLRLYNVATTQCYVSCNAADQHHGAVTSVGYASDYNVYASTSKDGAVKLWDAVSNRCISTWAAAHGGAEVSSAKFTKNGKYLLTAGKDSNVLLWELSTGRVVNAYKGAAQALVSSPAVFNHTEDFVMMVDETSTSFASWDSRTGEMQRPLASGHTNSISYMAHSPIMPAFISCGDDFKMRFFYHHSNTL
ncbi:cleavage stimulation factor subunit 1-like [Sycon ciliatum]|uniref:cleavage stimulation factor subunit 1-like n=1 Tax=Sycon ciliatum TaxID=27933 RepID=UPI0020ADA009|eukprot:scpid72843/ scgid11634/ Cleavage stimulation factor subunit 1; CF-1 50 kDa subunit; Cleavage stimulation factor 50 kDa subunit